MEKERRQETALLYSSGRVMNVDQSFVGCGRHDEKTFCFISTLERRAADRRHSRKPNV
jgi:hypothetical protein